MRLGHLICISALFASAASAEEPFLCSGENPDWKLGLGTETADFKYKIQIKMDIPHMTAAENRDWPKAYTLIGRDATAVVILNRMVCEIGDTDYPLTVHVLTQDGTAAIMLTGCCQDPKK